MVEPETERESRMRDIILHYIYAILALIKDMVDEIKELTNPRSNRQ